MKLASRLPLFLLVACCAALSAQPVPPAVHVPPPLPDSAPGFDSLLGNFTFHLRYIPHPLVPPTGWTDLFGTGACYPVWNGRAQLDTVELDGANGSHIEGLTLRLYDPKARQWRLYWANSRIGRLDPPQIGAFLNGRGDFYTTDTINGQTILIRFDWSRMSGTPHFEQAFSSDGGSTWAVNWITDQTRTGNAVWGQPQPGSVSTPLPGTTPPTPVDTRDGQHDFDFDTGSWKMHIRRLLHPLTGSTQWIEMEGTTVTHPIWNGRANLAEVEADTDPSSPSAHLGLLALRLYDPVAHQWSISFATSDVGVLSAVPAVGTFHDGRGTFYDSELYHGRNILVRFRIGPVSANEVHSDQAFSADGGRTWETNWINTYTRISNKDGD